mgnify:CR=1 FL=1
MRVSRNLITLAAMTGIAFSVSYSTPANAFGGTCVPTLYNCMCTFRVPCPVTDAKRFAEELTETARQNAKKVMMGLTKIPNQDFLQGLRGMTGNIPGLDSIGLDIGGLINGDLSALGLPSLPGDIAGTIKELGIDGNMISSLASGELTSGDFLDIAGNFGADLGMLSEVGLDISTIESIAGGNLGTSELFDVARNMGFEAGVMSDIGINPDLIKAVADGEINPGRIMDIARNAGLDMVDLSSVGLDISAIERLPDMARGEVMNIIQNAGFGSPVIKNLGLDAGMIGQIASGELPATAINDLVAGTGIDPSAITIPSINGPVSIDGIRPEDRFDDMAIPAASIPGLENIISGDGSGGGFGSNGGLFASSSANAAMCSNSKSLVSVGEPPNPFGGDIANIDMAISGGRVGSFAEARNDTRWAVKESAGFGMGRSIQIRPIIPKALDSIKTFQKMMKESKSLQDDIIINDTITSQLMTAKAEKTSLLSSVATMRATRNLQKDDLSPVPTFPNDSRFEEAFRASESRQKSRQNKISTGNFKDASEDYGNFQRKARTAILHHNLQRDAQIIETTMPGVAGIIDDHETYKQFLVGLEDVITTSLGELYENPGAAWDRMRPELYAGSGDYLDPGKQAAGARLASSISAAATAQTATTKYGTRKRNTGRTTSTRGRDGENETPPFTVASPTPFSYISIDNYASRESDPYKITGSTGSSRSSDSSDQGRDHLVGVLQYYITTHRRVKWKARTRRGESDRAMTGALWNEMLTHAPECITGPLPTNETNIRKRPELFDLDKNCNHMFWSGGDEGDYIDASYLGGADAALWVSKTTLDQTERRTGGPDRIRETIRSAIESGEESDAATVFEMHGQRTTVNHIDRTLDTLNRALQDRNFLERIEFPLE